MNRFPSFSPRGKTNKGATRPRNVSEPIPSSGGVAAPPAGSSFLETTTVMVHLQRGPAGHFGMSLNNYNRLTATDPDGPAEIAKLQVMDRITKVDGADLASMLSAVAKGKDAMMLTVERPPRQSYAEIMAYETWGGCKGPFTFETAPKRDGRTRSVSGQKSEQERIDQMLEGRTTLMIILSREVDSEFKDFGLVLGSGDSCVVSTALPNSPAHKAGVLQGDLVTKVNGKELRGGVKRRRSTWSEVSGKAGQNVVLTVERISKIVSDEAGDTHVVSAEL